MKKRDKILRVVMLISLIVFVVSSASRMWVSGSSEDDYRIVCIGGHEYYRTNFFYKTTLAIRMDDNGKPIQCK